MRNGRQSLKIRPRSVIPGRQRWDIAVVLGRPRIAEFLEARLRESEGVGKVCANPVTGRLLVLHDTTLSRQQVDRLVREAVGLAIRRTTSHTGARGPERSMMLTRVRHHGIASLWTLPGAVIFGGFLCSSPLVRLGAVLVTTVVTIRRVWRKTSYRHQDSVLDGSIWRPVQQIVGSHRRKFYLASTLSVLGLILEVFPSLLFSRIYLLLTTGKSARLSRLGLSSVSGQLWFFTGAAALVSVVGAALSSIVDVHWRNLAQSVQNEWRTEMYAHVQRAGLQYLEGERTTRLTTVLTDDINQLGRFLATSANSILRLGTSFVFLIAMFLFFAPGIAWIALLPVSIIVWLSFLRQDRTASDYAATGEVWMQLNSQLTNNLQGSATVKNFCTEDYEIDRIRRLSERYRQSNHRIDARTAAYIPMVRACAEASFAGIVVSGGAKVLTGGLSFPVFALLSTLPQLIIYQLSAFGDTIDQYQRTVAALGRVVSLLELPVESAGIGKRLDRAQASGEVVFDNVTFAYPDRPPVVHNLSVRIASQKTTGIVGATGAGKTTTVKLLLRFYDVASGRVSLDGQDIRDVQLHDLRSAIGYVAQDDFLFDGTVKDNIRYGSFDADPEHVMRAAQLAAANDFIQALPQQYDTIIGERGVMLSPGQRQRLCLARALLKAAPILILDEATSAVDNETEAIIQGNLKSFATGRTLIVIAHRLSTIRHADWIYVLDTGGSVAEEGTHQELLALEGLYASLWRVQIGQANASPDVGLIPLSEGHE